MKATILHDEHGRILAISNIEDREEAGSRYGKVGMIPGAGQQIIEVELSRDDEARPLSELHEDYRVDLATSSLVEKD
jgi:hypothetical protein